MNPIELLKQALDALVNPLVLEEVRIEQAIALLNSALKHPYFQPKTNQCGEVCERAKFCAICLQSMHQPTTEPEGEK
jgi:hypothetical protein